LNLILQKFDSFQASTTTLRHLALENAANTDQKQFERDSSAKIQAKADEQNKLQKVLDKYNKECEGLQQHLLSEKINAAELQASTEENITKM